MATNKKTAKKKAGPPVSKKKSKQAIPPPQKPVKKIGWEKHTKDPDSVTVSHIKGAYKIPPEVLNSNTKPLLRELTDKGNDLNKKLASVSTKIKSKINLIDSIPGDMTPKKPPFEKPKSIVEIIQNQQVVISNQVDRLELLYFQLCTLV